MAIRKGKVEGEALKSLLENIQADQSAYVRLHTAAQDAADAMNAFEKINSVNVASTGNSVNVNTFGGGGGGSTIGTVTTTGGAMTVGGGSSFTFVPVDRDAPVVRMSRPGFYMVGDREISIVVLLTLVDEFFKKQERIANPPKFDTPEQAQEWLDAVS